MFYKVKLVNLLTKKRVLHTDLQSRTVLSPNVNSLTPSQKSMSLTNLLLVEFMICSNCL